MKHSGAMYIPLAAALILLVFGCIGCVNSSYTGQKVEKVNGVDTVLTTKIKYSSQFKKIETEGVDLNFGSGTASFSIGKATGDVNEQMAAAFAETIKANSNLAEIFKGFLVK